jgi:hypothetical protein
VPDAGCLEVSWWDELRGFVQVFPPARPLAWTLSRWAKLGASSRVKVPVGRRGRKASSQGLATHPYRALGLWRSSRKAANKTG